MTDKPPITIEIPDDLDEQPDAEVEQETTEPEVEQPDEPETFPREYVTKLRDENAKYRQKAADRDDLAQRLHVALVAASGRLADPEDLPYDESHLSDADALSTALDDLLARKPHLGSRKPSGDVGQGAGSTDTGLDLAGLLRRNAG